MKSIYTSILLIFVAIQCYSQIKDGYTEKLSYRSGELVTFFTKHTGNQTFFEIKDLANHSLTPQPVFVSGFVPDIQFNLPNCSNDPWENGYNYAPTCTTSQVTTTLPSGYYLLDNNDPNFPDGKIPLLIKGDKTINGANIVIVIPTNTINAYTSNWLTLSCGKSLYDYNSYNGPATAVSFHRPQNRSQYSNCDDGFLKWMVSTFAPAHSYTYNYISDSDLEDYSEIENARLLIIPGHSEYWTRQARLNFDKFVDSGNDALILSGNTMWMQVRYENNNGNPQLICHRGINLTGNQYYDEDPIADPLNTTNYHPLQATYHWNEPDLKYSILGSIGSDSKLGCFGNSGFSAGGHKVLLDHTHSPLLSTTTLAVGDEIPMSTVSNEEFDGTLINSNENGNAILSNGEPELDISALGFYKAEMIGYHSSSSIGYVTTDPNSSNNHISYCPFMVFQKTSTSGTIINVNSNRWCTEGPVIGSVDYGWSGTSPLRATITQNIIERIMNNQNLFYSSIQKPIILKPSYNAVSYVACEDGSIHITPDGINLINAYKIDSGFVWNKDHIILGVVQPEVINLKLNVNVARVDHSCTTYHPLRIADKQKNKNEQDKEIKQNENLYFTLFPNPAISNFTLQMQSYADSEKNIYVYNSINQEVYRKEKILDSNAFVDLSLCTKGVYYVKVVIGDEVGVRKIIIL